MWDKLNIQTASGVLKTIWSWLSFELAFLLSVLLNRWILSSSAYSSVNTVLQFLNIENVKINIKAYRQLCYLLLFNKGSIYSLKYMECWQETKSSWDKSTNHVQILWGPPSCISLINTPWNGFNYTNWNLDKTSK